MYYEVFHISEVTENSFGVALSITTSSGVNYSDPKSFLLHYEIKASNVSLNY